MLKLLASLFLYKSQRGFWTRMLGDEPAAPADFCRAQPSPCVL